MIEKHLKRKFTLDAAYYLHQLDPNCNVRGRGIDLRTSQRFRAGDEYTAEDEPTLRLVSFWADQTPVAFYGIATLSQSTLSPILGFIVYITSIQKSKAASPVVSMALTVSDGYHIDRHQTKRSLFAAGVIGCTSATQQDSGRPGTAPW